MVRVGYLGPEGTFTHLVVDEFFGSHATLIPLASLWQLDRALKHNTVDWIVVPEENSIGGMIKEALDIVRDGDRKIVAELVRPIRHALMKRPDNTPIDVILGHSQALHQCAKWLHQHYPWIAQSAQASNATAAEKAAVTAGAACVGHPGLAARLGLEVLHYPIQDRADNTTKFWVVANPHTHAQTAIDAIGLAHPSAKPQGIQSTWLMSIHDRPGALYHALEPLAREGVQLSRIESRPSQCDSTEGLWRYDFFLDVVGSRASERVSRAYASLKAEHPVVRVLGEYQTWWLEGETS